jgi:hypothetical protein
LAVTIIYQYFEMIAKEKERGADTFIFWWWVTFFSYIVKNLKMYNLH